MSQWIQTDKLQEKEHSAQLTTNLSKYMLAYHNARHNDSQAQQVYRTYYDELVEELTGLQGNFLWYDMLEKATQGMDEDIRTKINDCPISTFMKNSFIELVKNTLDEAILGGNPTVALTLSIDLSKMPDNISMSFSDKGRGYPDAFIQKLMVDKGGREQYILEQGSPKHLEHDQNKHPDLFGGKGRGLRMLLANLEGNELIKNGVLQHKYQKPEYAEVHFSNQEIATTGAIMTISTSIAPLQAYTIASSLTNQHTEHVTHAVNNHRPLHYNNVSQSSTDNELSDEEINNTSVKNPDRDTPYKRSKLIEERGIFNKQLANNKAALHITIEQDEIESLTDNSSDEETITNEEQRIQQDPPEETAVIPIDGSFLKKKTINGQATKFQSFKKKFNSAIKDDENTDDVSPNNSTCR